MSGMKTPKHPLFTFHFPLSTQHPIYMLYMWAITKRSRSQMKAELHYLRSWVAWVAGQLWSCSCGVGEIVAGANAKFVCSPNNGSHFFCFALFFCFFCCIWYFIQLLRLFAFPVLNLILVGLLRISFSSLRKITIKCNVCPAKGSRKLEISPCIGTDHYMKLILSVRKLH